MEKEGNIYENGKYIRSVYGEKKKSEGTVRKKRDILKQGEILLGETE